MGNPYLNKDESIILATHKVMVKSVSSDVLLTNQRLIIVESGHDQFRPHTIPLALIETISLRENPSGDPEISVSIEPPTRDDATIMAVLSFSQMPGELRTQEIAEWTTKLRENVAIARELALHTGEKPVYPEAETDQGSAPPPQPGPNAGTIRITPRQPSFRQRIGLRTKPVEKSPGKFPDPSAVSPLDDIPASEGPVASDVGSVTGTSGISDQTDSGSPASTPKRSPIFVVAGIAVLILIVAAAVIFVPGFVPGNTPVIPTEVPQVTTSTTIIPTLVTTIPAPSPQTPQITPVITAGPRYIIPQTGVWARINSAGNFTGSIGAAGKMRPVSGSGNQFYQIPARNEIVEAAIQKQDGSGNLLTVEIYNNGLPMGNTTTSSPNGAIDLHVAI